MYIHVTFYVIDTVRPLNFFNCAFKDVSILQKYLKSHFSELSDKHVLKLDDVRYLCFVCPKDLKLNLEKY